MAKKPSTKPQGYPKGPNVWELLGPYKGLIALLVVLTIAGNALNLVIPKMIAGGIDAYTTGSLVVNTLVIEFALIAVGVFIFTYIQTIVQTIASERVARDLRTKLAAKISEQEYSYIQQVTPAKLLTNLTSDIDNIKNFVSQAVASMVSSVFLIIGASALLLMINWKLALAVLATLPIIAGTFTIVFGKVRALFKQAQEAIDWLNKVINESILGSSLIRLLNSQQLEYDKFLAANARAKEVSVGILRLFASMIPVVTFVANLATLIILLLGGRFVINGSMTLGNFTAFNNYLAILIFPIFVLGFSSSLIAQASASYARISEVLKREPKKTPGLAEAQTNGDITLKDVSVVYGEKSVLKGVSFTAKAGTKTAIIGPTAAGKTQLLYLLTGLLAPASGSIEYAGKPLTAYDPVSIHQQIGFVFQDSIIFNLTLRENIAFSSTVSDADLKKAIETAELHDFIDALPQGLDTVVSERGTSLSGGQKQRIMLARALALNPSVLLLDDFTARVDATTEQKILKNVHQNYPGMSIISVTQKIAPIENYDQIILLMEGELLASGTHQELMEKSPEYVQIYDSQKSTNAYELQAE
jgi:ATP-binding cassette subfamily B protein